jgi:ferrous iron transport protein B
MSNPKITEKLDITDQETFKIALVGAPNSGKSSLFNALTGSRQKVANYPGVTVERRSGTYITAAGDDLTLIDLPGLYSLNDRSLDETVSRQVITGVHATENQPDLILCVLDSTNLRVQLRLVLELRSLEIPMVVVLNMSDIAKRDDIEIDSSKLATNLGLKIITTTAVRRSGLASLKDLLDKHIKKITALKLEKDKVSTYENNKELQKQARELAEKAIISEGHYHKATKIIDNILLHPILGLIMFFSMMIFMFQSVFSWAEAPMDMIENGFGLLAEGVTAVTPDNWLRSLLNDGIIAGVGSVLVFLPQIIILFAFILILESTGYMARAAFLMDKLMGLVGLNGRAFIPLLSSFACAIPGIMAARTIASNRDRIITIMIAPLMACSARMPVYTLLIGAFIPDQEVWGYFNMKGLVLFGLFFTGIIFALIVAFIMKITITKGVDQPFLMELPKYQLPLIRNILLGLWERSKAFLRRAGTIILGTNVALWLLALYPTAPNGSGEPDINHSIIGIMGKTIQPFFEPLGFTWEMCIALLPGMAAREVAVGALGTVYALQGDEDQVASSLEVMIAASWSLPTALAFLTWYIFAPQCFATLATAKRETNSWAWTGFMAGYLFALAYFCAWGVNVLATNMMS